MTNYFVYLFLFRYIRLVVHIVSFWLYRPTPVPRKPTVRPRDCTVIIPTNDLEHRGFEECLMSCLINEPGVVLIVTTSSEMTSTAKAIVAPYQQRFPYTKISVKASSIANKRMQIAHGLGYVSTKIVVLLDDHVFWPSARFLPALLAPLENPNIGIVGTNKRLRRTERGFSFASFWNMLGALDLERQNFETRATNALDGGVFAVSSLTSAHRSEILTDRKFLDAFTDGYSAPAPAPAVVEDHTDSFITRWTVGSGYRIKIQYSDDAQIETTLPSSGPDFLTQSLQASRIAWRNNASSLLTELTPWYRHPWCIYAVHLTSLVNFALPYDAALIYTLHHSKLAKEDHDALHHLLRWILLSKLIKVTPYFLREHQDILLLPGYILFGYFHSLIKLYALLTPWGTEPVDDENAPPPLDYYSPASPIATASGMYPSSPRHQHRDSDRDLGDYYRDGRYVTDSARVVIQESPDPLAVFAPAAAAAKRPRGRPRSATPNVGAPGRRGRKTQAQAQVVIPSIEAPVPPPVKRGRGRPRKNPL
ncbi:uncharacterized protein BJX67DRAFT_389502 [Aspergillus lucknowensis]|uniref:Nucleotide-diphospho-sugar transferase n=1 Tax=Aspergillus lucknowensis TaxID=176173 RepID=A0ABR4LL76_9EURO